MTKTLYRCTEGKMIFGVCKGISEYFNVDVSIVRIATVFLGFTVAGLVAYIAAGFILPRKD